LETLEDYLASDYLAEKQEVADIERTLKEVMSTFAETFNSDTGWPYEYKTNASDPMPGSASLASEESARSDTTTSTTSATSAPAEKSKASQGTLAMVLVATGRVLGYCALPKSTYAKGDDKHFDAVRAPWEEGLKLLLKSLTNSSGVYSSTFGEDNSLTLSFLTELYCLLNSAKFSEKRTALSEGFVKAQSKLKALLKGDIAAPDLLKFDGGEKVKKSYLSNAFVPLRAIRAASDLDILSPDKARHRQFFEKTLHQQLSYSSIPDSRFDPAELIFSLEGLLLCAREAVDNTIFDRVLQVLQQQQDTSAHWRPNKPFIATSQGMILLPISVEGANSLMRSIAMMDHGLLHETFTAKSLPLLLRFWRWLRARSTRFDLGSTRCVGWHSEHVNEQNLIHLWDTSQVAEFMVFFREMLERHIATKALRLSRLSVKSFPLKEGDSTKKTADQRWNNKKGELGNDHDGTAQTFEPLLGAPDDKKIYRQLYNDFVDGWSKKSPTNYSMLLYGPPGTGKTSVAENLAEVLDMRLITVTVSDFLGSGGPNVESRAKAIFQTLEAQESVVILFDEIDSFLLDRDSERYQDQESLFQFLTPGMLTKINDLRKAEKSIFIIATNYANRIDPAIKRTGRIDKQYLVSLPDKLRRVITLRLDQSSASSEERDDIGRVTVFYGYKDLDGARKDLDSEKRRKELTGDGAKNTGAELLERVRKRKPSTSLDSYLKRLKDDEEFPGDEFYGLVLLVEEVGRQAEIGPELRRYVNTEDEFKKLCTGLDDQEMIGALRAYWENQDSSGTSG
jgi:hypothetical protein